MAKLDIKKKLVTRSDRVKCVDLHPTEPWVLSSFYDGKVTITNYKTQQVVKTFDVCNQPVRSARFIARKRWIVTGSDDLMIRVFNYNTGEREKQFEAHEDYIRCVTVHPTRPYLLSCGDDYTIRLWDWEQNFACVRIFEGHAHYVMEVAFNPKDPNTFASASLDSTVRVWSINSSAHNFILNGHGKEVNCVAYYHGGDKPLLASGSDDQTVKVWDYQTKSCIQTLEGHSNNISALCFHPKLPYIISGSEDFVVNVWNANTYKLEESINQGFERVWSFGYTQDTKLAIGYDMGTVVLKLGKESPVVTMDRKGKVVLIQGSEVQSLTVKVPLDGSVSDGEKLSLAAAKELGATDLAAIKVRHDSKGHHVAVIGESDYTIHNAISFKNKTFGAGEDFVWGEESGSYAVRERSSTGNIKVFADFKQHKSFKPYFTPRQLFGGHLLAARSEDSVALYDWSTCSFIRSLDVVPKAIYWNEKGDLVVFACESSFYVLRLDLDMIKQAVQAGTVSDDGVEGCMEVEEEIAEKVREGQWVGDCFIYVNNQNRLNYFIGTDTVTIAHLEKTYFFLGFVQKLNRVFLMDKERNIISYQLHVTVMQYEAAVINGDLDAAAQILPDVPKQFHNQLARFLSNQGHRDLALSVTTDADHKFDLALETGQFDVAHEIAKRSDSELKWKQLGSIALAKCELKLAEECMKAGKDYSGLLLLYTSIGHRKGLEELAAMTEQEGKFNVSYMCYFSLGNVDKCIDILIHSGRLTEAAFVARTYAPSQASRVVKLWKESLGKVNERAAEALADPEELPNLFPDWDVALAVEKDLRQRSHESQQLPSSSYPERKQDAHRDLIAEWKLNKGGDVATNGTEQGSTTSIEQPSEEEQSEQQQEDGEEAQQQQHPKKKQGKKGKKSE